MCIIGKTKAKKNKKKKVDTSVQVLAITIQVFAFKKIAKAHNTRMLSFANKIFYFAVCW